MKKLMLAVVTALLTVSALFAGEANEIKKTVLRDIEFSRTGKLIESLKYYTGDVSLVSNGEVMHYDMMKTMALALDGKHPEEFLHLLHMVQTKKAPTPEQKKQLNEVAKDEQFRAAYSFLCRKILSLSKKSAELEAKSINFTNVKVQGSKAFASYSYTALDPKDLNGIKQDKRSVNAEFRKENGIWKFSKVKSVSVK